MEKLAREAEQLKLALEALEADQAERLVTASPAVVAVVETRPKCRTGTAPLPEHLPREDPRHPLAHIDHLPLCGQAEIFVRDRVNLETSTLSGWVGATAASPLTESLLQFTSVEFTQVLRDRNQHGWTRAPRRHLCRAPVVDVKHDWVNLRPAANGIDQKPSLAGFFDCYNLRRPRQTPGCRTPKEAYLGQSTTVTALAA